MRYDDLLEKAAQELWASQGAYVSLPWVAQVQTMYEEEVSPVLRRIIEELIASTADTFSEAHVRSAVLEWLTPLKEATDGDR